MSFVTSTIYFFDGTGTEIPAFNINASYAEAFLVGSAVATGNYALVPSGSPSQGSKVVIKYNGQVDITTNARTFSIFGVNITQNILNTVFSAECEYYNSQWNVNISPSMTNFVINASTQIGAGTITGTMIANNTITNADMTANSIATVNLQDRSVTQIKHALTSVGTPELIPLAVDSTILAANAVTTTKINTAAVTNAKLALGPTNSIKVTDNSTVVTDISLGTNQLIANLGSGIQAVSKAQVVSGIYETITFSHSFESGEQGPLFIYLTYNCNIISAYATVMTTISGTDNGSLVLRDSRLGIDFATLPFPAGQLAGTATIAPSIAYNYVSTTVNDGLSLETSKVTPGGRIFVSILVQRT